MSVCDLIEMMARGEMAGAYLPELRALVGALLVRIGAAGAETAAGRRVQGAGHIALHFAARAVLGSASGIAEIRLLV